MGNFFGDLWDAGKRKAADVSSDVRTGFGIAKNFGETVGKTISSGMDIGGEAVTAVAGTAYDAGKWLVTPVVDTAIDSVQAVGNFGGYISTEALIAGADLGNTVVGFWSDSRPFGTSGLEDARSEFKSGMFNNIGELLDTRSNAWSDEGWNEVEEKTRNRIDKFMNATDEELLEYKTFVDAQWESTTMMVAANAEADRRLAMGEDPDVVDDDFREAYAMARAMSPDLTADDWLNLTLFVAAVYLEKAAVTPFKKQVFKLLDETEDLPSVISWKDPSTGVTAVLPDTPQAKAALALVQAAYKAPEKGNLVGDFVGKALPLGAAAAAAIPKVDIDLSHLDKLKGLDMQQDGFGVAGVKRIASSLPGALPANLLFQDPADQRAYEAFIAQRYESNRASAESKRWKDNRTRQGPSY